MTLELDDQKTPSRYRTQRDHLEHVPVHVVWEITLACNLKCQHCGSRAGLPRPSELSTRECLEVVDALAEMGTREVSLIGGEAYLRKDWVDIIRAIKDYGMYCAIQTGARALTNKRLDSAVEAGLDGVGVSIDGLEELHDRLRGVPGSYQMAVDAVRRIKSKGLNVSCNTQIGPETIAQLPELMDVIIDAGATHWQIQLTVAMGNAVDNEEVLLQPYQLAELIPLLADLSIKGRARGLLMIVGNNIGYFGPYEHVLRGAAAGMRPYWTGCAAGQTALGIESDGTIKGCPSLATNGYAGGNVRDKSVRQIWLESDEIHFGRVRQRDHLWGFCGDCYYADACKAGCTWTSDSLVGRKGNNPYCHYRVLELQKQGLRECVKKVEEAPDQSFAVGRFEIVLESIAENESASNLNYDRTKTPQADTSKNNRYWLDATHRGQLPVTLDICHGCSQYVWPYETVCPHCEIDLKTAQQNHEQEEAERKQAIKTIERLLSKYSRPGHQRSAPES